MNHTDNDVHAFMRALADPANNGREVYVDAGVIHLRTRDCVHTINMRWLNRQCLVPIIADELLLARLRPTLMSMRVGNGFTWNDYARRFYEGIVTRFLPTLELGPDSEVG